MIVGGAVCPGAPFLIPGTADALLRRSKTLRVDCESAVRRLPESDILLLVTQATGRAQSAPCAGHAFEALPPEAVISSSPLRRSDVVDRHQVRLAGWVDDGSTDSITTILEWPTEGVASGSSSTDHMTADTSARPSVGTMVGAQLVSSQLVSSQVFSWSGAAGEHRPAVVGVEVTDPGVTADVLGGIVRGPERVALLVIADGAACHGDDAPGRRDDRSAGFDADLSAALAAGDPAALLAACRPEIAAELLASVAPLQVLALLTADTPPIGAELLYHDAPFGVGYLVASWTWVAL